MFELKKFIQTSIVPSHPSKTDSLVELFFFECLTPMRCFSEGPCPRQLLADLPHVYVSDWEPLRPAALLRRWEALANDSRPRFRLARLYMPWWAVHVLLRCLEVP